MTAHHSPSRRSHTDDVRGAHASPAGTLPVPGTPRGLASVGADASVVTATDGSVVRVADGETRVASLAHAPLADVVQSDGRSYAVGGDGVAFTGRDGRWLAQDTGVDAAVHAVATDVATVAVGRHGTVLVR
jgi:hypothetical protein